MYLSGLPVQSSYPKTVRFQRIRVAAQSATRPSSFLDGLGLHLPRRSGFGVAMAWAWLRFPVAGAWLMYPKKDAGQAMIQCQASFETAFVARTARRSCSSLLVTGQNSPLPEETKTEGTKAEETKVEGTKVEGTCCLSRDHQTYLSFPVFMILLSKSPAAGTTRHVPCED